MFIFNLLHHTRISLNPPHKDPEINWIFFVCNTILCENNEKMTDYIDWSFLNDNNMCLAFIFITYIVKKFFFSSQLKKINHEKLNNES